MTDTSNLTTASIVETFSEYPLNVLVFYRGDWCPFCQSYLRELNGEFRSQVEAAGGRIIAITSQSAEAADQTRRDWGLGYGVVSDPTTALAQQFGINVTPKEETPLAEHPTEYPNGMTQTGVIVLDQAGEVIYNWAIDPTETNLHGASDRPLPAEVWNAIEAKRSGSTPAPTDGRRLDPQFLADNYPEQHAAFEAWVASMSA